MKRHSLWWSLLVLALAIASPLAARAATTVDVRIGIGSAPPPPVVVFLEEPRVVYLRESRVYMVDDDDLFYDCFRYRDHWYIFSAGYWYRATSYRGPFRAIENRYVPAAILRVPERRWKHHPHGGPPGLMKRERAAMVMKEKHGHGRGQGPDEND